MTDRALEDKLRAAAEIWRPGHDAVTPLIEAVALDLARTPRACSRWTVPR